MNPTLTPEQQTARDLIPINIEQCEFSHTALDIRDGIKFTEWLHLGNKLGSVEGSVAWWVGDWINYGIEHNTEWEGKPKKVLAAKLLTHLDPHSCANYAAVAASVAKSRRRDSLSFGHHDNVSNLPPNQQSKWLKKAEENGWSRADMRAAMRAEACDSEEEPGKPLKTVLSWVMQGWRMIRDLGEPEKLPIETQRQLKGDLQDIGLFWQRLAS